MKDQLPTVVILRPVQGRLYSHCVLLVLNTSMIKSKQRGERREERSSEIIRNTSAYLGLRERPVQANL